MVVTVSIDEFAGGPDEVQDARAFIKLFNRATEEKDDAHRLRVFANYLEVDGEAEKWFEELPTAEKAEWPSVQTAFLAAFKHAPIVEKSVADCEEELMGLRMSTSELVSKVEGKNGRKVWAHMVMADRMLALAKGAGVAAGSNLIRTVINNLPRGLKERVAGTYANWEEFVKALKEVDMEAVVASVEGLMRDEKARAEQDEKIKQLQAMIMKLNVGGGGGGSGGSTGGNGSGGGGGGRTGGRNMQARPPLTKELQEEVRKGLAEMVHHPDTPEGRRAYLEQIKSWEDRHGVEGWVLEKTLMRR
ncbi:hypothetical protein EST38_g13626 [Candolleomyces aberdarensis]|uniref:Retrotransposon gag domain-containing protein n=1 Tax=Candolleomyces aberdarensis TaxID=2316362 RepID=A0A4V1Q1N7_9AGAR|nr:hypothetical protein EST38_g13626 [Candolleomyces aberdarensis]